MEVLACLGRVAMGVAQCAADSGEPLQHQLCSTLA